jgi:hypothetical protein
LHSRQVLRAERLQLRELEQCVTALQLEAVSPDLTVHLRAGRDLTLLLLSLGFWRAFRSDDLCRVRIETSQLIGGRGSEPVSAE